MSDGTSSRLSLPQVTAIAVTSVNVEATVAALRTSIAQVQFGAVKVLSDAEPSALPLECEWVPIKRLGSSKAYSQFILQNLADYVETSHCLLMQWDGYILSPHAWRSDFLDYDYIGASWPQFSDGKDVGNGGFSLRSRELLEACRGPEFTPLHPEDLAIGRHNRSLLEEQGIRFAPVSLADEFSSERSGDINKSFGFHGVWHMPSILGPTKFFDLYRGLDDFGSVRYDFRSLLRQMSKGSGGWGRAAAFIRDRIFGFATTRKRSGKASN